MKQLALEIEHKHFKLNIQDEYYDSILAMFAKKGLAGKDASSSVADLLSLCIDNAIQLTDSHNLAKSYIEKIDNLDSQK